MLGGDYTITLGAVAGLWRHRPGVGLVYVDGDADLGIPDAPDAPGSRTFESKGVAHLPGAGAPELAGFAGPSPLLPARQFGLVGCDPREIDESGRRFLTDRAVSFQEALGPRAHPVAAAERALAALADAGSPILGHFDVDAGDSGDLPPGNFPHYRSGVLLEQVIECLRVLGAHPLLAGLVLTEVNPTQDPDRTLIGRYVAGIAD